MLKRQADLTPAERRVRRRRILLYSTSTAILVATLLAVAWFGMAATRIVPPRMLDAAPPPDARLTIDVTTIERSLQALMTREDPELAERFRRQFPVLRSAIHPQLEILFWEQAPPDSDDDASWTAFVPLRRPQRLYLELLRDELKAATELWPADKPLHPDTPPPLAYWQVTPAGALFHSHPTLRHRVTPVPRNDTPAAAAVYSAPDGYLSPWIARRMEPETILILTAPNVSSITIQWTPPTPGNPGTVHLEIQEQDNTGARRSSHRDLPWFDPLVSVSADDLSENRHD